MVRAQMLSELEEIILYKQNADQPDRQQSIRRTWMKRLAIDANPISSMINVLLDSQTSGLSTGC